MVALRSIICAPVTGALRARLLAIATILTLTLLSPLSVSSARGLRSEFAVEPGGRNFRHLLGRDVQQ